MINIHKILYKYVNYVRNLPKNWKNVLDYVQNLPENWKNTYTSWFYYLDKSNNYMYTYTKTVFVKVPKQHISKELLDQPTMNHYNPDYSWNSRKIMNMSELFPHKSNFYYYIMDLSFRTMTERINDWFSLEKFTEKDLVYLPIQIDAELFSNDELITCCNYYEYDDIPIDDRANILGNLWFQYNYDWMQKTPYTRESLWLYTKKIKSLKRIFLLLSTNLHETELDPNATWLTIPIVVNTYGVPIEIICHNLVEFPWYIYHQKKWWQIMYAATRPIES